MVKICQGCSFNLTCHNRKHNTIFNCITYRKLTNKSILILDHKNKQKIKNNTLMSKYKRKQFNNLINDDSMEDCLDSKGEDITDEEFIDNEKDWALLE